MSAMADPKRRLTIQEKIGIAVRKARGLDKNQEDVADKAGITRTYLSAIENGKVDVSVFVLYLIAEAMNTTLSEMLKGVG